MPDLHDTGDAGHSEGKHRRMFEASRDSFDQSWTSIFEPSMWRPLEGVGDLTSSAQVTESPEEEKKSDKLPLDIAKSGKADWVIDRVAERGVGGEHAEDVAYVAKQV